MVWSTRQLAELAGTSVSTIRYYHRERLLEEPEREANGYKRYEIRHLISVLRIRRLAELGVAHAEIAAMERDGLASPDVPRLDAELEETIARLRTVREQLAEIERYGAPGDLPPGFSDVAAQLTPPDRAIVMIYSRVFGERQMRELHDFLTVPRPPEEREFDALPPDADPAVCVELADRLLPVWQRVWAERPWMREFHDGALRDGAGLVRRVVADAMVESYNPAQVDVLRRIHPLLADRRDEVEPAAGAAS